MLTLLRPALVERSSLALGGLQMLVLIAAWLFAPAAVRRSLQDAAAEDAASGSDDMFGIGEAMSDMVATGVKLEFGIGFYLALLCSVAIVALVFYARRQRAGSAATPVAEG